jgi:hypothetical protein
MYRIRRFGIVKTATTVAVLYMVVVAVFLVPFLLLFAAAASNLPTGATNISVGVGSMVAIGLVAIFGYGLVGWVITAISCALYNLVAGWVGGVEIQLEAVAAPPPVPVWGPSTTPPAAPPPPASPPAG